MDNEMIPFPMMFGPPKLLAEDAKPLSLDVIREVLAAHLPRIMGTTSGFKAGDELVQPPGASVYSIGTPECPAIFVRYLERDERTLEDCHGEVDCLVAGVNGPTVGVWPAASWRFVLFTGTEPERALTKLSEYCAKKCGVIPLDIVRELFPSEAEATRWFYMHGWSRELRRVRARPEVVFVDQEKDKDPSLVSVIIIDGVVEDVSALGDRPETV